jgi:hypothetical protein
MHVLAEQAGDVLAARRERVVDHRRMSISTIGARDQPRVRASKYAPLHVVERRAP